MRKSTDWAARRSAAPLASKAEVVRAWVTFCYRNFAHAKYPGLAESLSRMGPALGLALGPGDRLRVQGAALAPRRSMMKANTEVGQQQAPSAATNTHTGALVIHGSMPNTSGPTMRRC